MKNKEINKTIKLSQTQLMTPKHDQKSKPVLSIPIKSGKLQLSVSFWTLVTLKMGWGHRNHSDQVKFN